MTNFGCSDSSSDRKNNYVRIENLSGVEAEVIRRAVDCLLAEKLNITPYDYQVSIFFNNNYYVVFFEKAKSASLGAINSGYEVVISARSLNVIRSEFSR